jgi:hypothetical protein
MRWNSEIPSVLGPFHAIGSGCGQILSPQIEGEHAFTCAAKKYQLLHCFCCENPNQFLIKVAIVSLLLFIHGAIFWGGGWSWERLPGSGDRAPLA